MLQLIMQRIALGVLLLFMVSVLIFVGTEVLPGDVATAILGQGATPDAVEAIRRSLGLNEPAITRYWDWLAGFLQGDLGTSLANGRPISEQLSFRLKNTLFLAGVAAIVTIPLALVLGILSAINQSSLFDRFVNVLTLSLVSLPEFLIGYVLILIFAVQAGWYPSLASVSRDMEFGERLHSIVLPAAALAMGALAHTMRMTRAVIIGVMSAPYIEMAFLKGIARWRIVVEHALPNALAPIINVIALTLAWLVVGVVVIEVVFVYPGMGQLMVDAVSKRDVPVIQACGLIFAITYVGLNMVADLLAIIANPRLRSPK